MEKTIKSEKVYGNVNVAAAQVANVNKNEELKDEQSNNYGIALRGELKDPEVTGTDTLDIKLELPFGGRLEIKASSQVTSSVLAQQTLNEEARKNMASLTEFLTKAAMVVAPVFVQIKETSREQDAKDNEAYAELRKNDAELDMEIEKKRKEFRHEMEMEDIKRYHERRMLEMQLDKEYNEN